ncbi:MAG: undecaprenyl-diphosphate phosphatase [Spirochaetales bacterium]|nr:undecaprenyl-diphosphate phosphatase [Spirochaetales bacterium]
MNALQALLLGVFQGIAEFLPISSSGHLLIFKDLLGLSEVPVLFDVILHVATLLSIVLVFRKRVGGIFASVWRWLRRKHDQGDADNLAIVRVGAVATVLTAVVGLAVERVDLSARPAIVAGMFLVTAAILVVSSRFKGSDQFRSLTLRHGVIVGVAQGLGVFPGISRSGITIGAGLASGMERNTAGEFAFLLAIPTILGALVLKLPELGELGSAVPPLSLAVGAMAAFGFGVLALLALMPLVRRGRLAWFAAYLVPAGILGLLFLR